MSCAKCDDTGSLSKDIGGYLDCAHCDVAQERAALENWMLLSTSYMSIHNAAWLIYQHGKAAAER